MYKRQVYGSQFKVSSFKFSSPEDAAGMERYLGSGAMPESGKKASFERNEDNPLEADVIIVDEMSMVDIQMCIRDR